ncbi:MAG: ribosome biogenesis GTPase Der [Candidatus Omnitrophota bacterium]
MEKYNSIPSICIIGRPNVGKSSLFNILIGERRSVVVERSGTTRDRVEAIVNTGNINVKIVDTGGYLSEDKDVISLEVKDQICRAIEEASVILFVTDTIDGVSPFDVEVAALLRKFSKTVILVANKTDNEKLIDDAVEFYQLGFGAPETISCLHRRGIRGLKQKIQESVESFGLEKEPSQKKCIKIAVVGRPNVGKSSLINNLLERKRVIVSDIPGTTRDSIDTYFSYEDTDYILIDTAGIRHKRKVKDIVDTYSMMRSQDAIKRADVVLLLFDAAEGITRDDMGILDLIEETGSACLILVNKWDLAKDAEDVSMQDYEKHLLYASNRLRKFSIFFVSAKTGRNVVDMLSMVKVLDTNLDLEVSTGVLNRIFKSHDPSLVAVPRRYKRPNFLYVIQSRSRPVEFKYFVNSPQDVRPSHLSFIENQLRSNLPLKGIPIKILIRRSKKNSK